MTVPPPKETFRAFGKLVRAASVVLEFASVATRMPIFPATAEKIAPMTKAGTIIQCVESTIIEIPYNAADAKITNIDNSLYSADKKAIAPSLMLLEISCMRSLPGFCFFTHAILTNMKIKPTMARAIGTKINLFSILFLLFYQGAKVEVSFFLSKFKTQKKGERNSPLQILQSKLFRICSNTGTTTENGIIHIGHFKCVSIIGHSAKTTISHINRTQYWYG